MRDFHVRGNHPVAEIPTLLPANRVEPRVAWMREEIEEFESAGSVVDQADAIIDLMYFALGTLVEMGVDAEALFDIVHRANMKKVSESVTVRADGKIQKPADWVTPESEMAASIVETNSPFKLVVADEGESWAAIEAMAGLHSEGENSTDSSLFGAALPVEGDLTDDFVSWSLMSEADFQDYVDQALAVYPVVVVGFRVGQVYRSQDTATRFALIVRRTGNRVLLVDPGPDSAGARSVNIDDLYVGAKSAFDGLHRVGPRRI